MRLTIFRGTLVAALALALILSASAGPFTAGGGFAGAGGGNSSSVSGTLSLSNGSSTNPNTQIATNPSISWPGGAGTKATMWFDGTNIAWNWFGGIGAAQMSIGNHISYIGDAQFPATGAVQNYFAFGSNLTSTGSNYSGRTGFGLLLGAGHVLNMNHGVIVGRSSTVSQATFESGSVGYLFCDICNLTNVGQYAGAGIAINVTGPDAATHRVYGSAFGNTLALTGTGTIVGNLSAAGDNITYNNATPSAMYFYGTQYTWTTNLNNLNGTIIGANTFANNTQPPVAYTWYDADNKKIKNVATNGVVSSGTSTNDAAGAGNIGEIITATAAPNAVSLSTGTTANVTSASLTAGDWDCSGTVNYTYGATTSITNLTGGPSQTSATLPTQDSRFDWETAAQVPTGGAVASFPTPVTQQLLSATTTVFLTTQATFTVSTLGAGGTLRCRRMR